MQSLNHQTNILQKIGINQQSLSHLNLQMYWILKLVSKLKSNLGTFMISEKTSLDKINLCPNIAVNISKSDAQKTLEQIWSVLPESYPKMSLIF
jgi:hypothetical protein